MRITAIPSGLADFLRRWLFTTLAWLVLAAAPGPARADSHFVNVDAPHRPRLIVFVHGLGSGKDEGLWEIAKALGAGYGKGRTPLADLWPRYPETPGWPRYMQDDPAFAAAFSVFEFEYGTAKLNVFEDGDLPIQGIADELRLRLAQNDVDLENFAEVYFIAHSMGGVIVRQALLRDPGLARKTRAIFLFATPMNGSSIAAWADYVGVASTQTAQLAEVQTSPDTLFNHVKDEWYAARSSQVDPALGATGRPTPESFCAFETTGHVVERSSVEPLCNRAVVPLRGSHSEIVKVPADGGFFPAHELLARWMGEILPDFRKAAMASQVENRVVIATCSGNEAYKGPYGRVHEKLREFLGGHGVAGVRYSLPLPQTWIPSVSVSDFTDPATDDPRTVPETIIIHFSCFQNLAEANALSDSERNTNFLSFLRDFSDRPTKIVVYSRTFRGGCAFFDALLSQDPALATAYAGRIAKVAMYDGEVPGQNEKADERILEAVKNADPGNTCFRRSGP